jgi:site-specific recombinase XerD
LDLAGRVLLVYGKGAKKRLAPFGKAAATVTAWILLMPGKQCANDICN